MSYWPQRFLLNRSDLVVTVSETTQKLIQSHRLTRKQTAVVYNAAGSKAEAAAMQLPKSAPSGLRTLVYMGSFMPYKNVETLIEAAGKLPDFELQLLSRIDGNRQQQLQALADSKSAKVRFFNGVSEFEYSELLSAAVALVSASKDEGFGIPLVEAMSRGIPVVVSDIEIFREIAGVAGLLCPADDADAFATAIQGLKDSEEWLSKSVLSKTQAEKFNWDASAAKLYEALSRL